MRAIGAWLKNKQIRDARLDALGLLSVCRAAAVEVASAACLPANKQTLLASQAHARNLKLRLGLLVPLPLITAPAAPRTRGYIDNGNEKEVAVG